MATGSAGVARVRSALAARGASFEIRELAQSTRTVADAARAVGCDPAQIAKSIIFRGAASGRPVLVVASGTNRVDEAAVEAWLGERLAKADADFVRRECGFVIGGVPPLGHVRPLVTFIDADLLAFDDVWAAAGAPNAVFRIAPADLVACSDGTVAEIALRGI